MSFTQHSTFLTIKIYLLLYAVSLQFVSMAQESSGPLPILMFTTQTSIDSFFLANEGITTLDAEVIIYDLIDTQDPIINLDGFGNITTIKGRLDLSFIANITDLSGFSNLDSICAQLIISGDVGFKDFSGLSSLRHVSAVHLIETSGISTFKGLENITELANFLSIQNSPIDSLEGLQNVTSVGNIFFVNDMGLNIPNLNGLRGLEKVNFGFTIIGSATQPNLIKFDGLDNIGFIGKSIKIENVEQAEDVHFLSALSKINGDLTLRNAKNISLEGLSNIDSVIGSMIISDISTTSDLSELQKLEYIEEDFNVSGLNSLESLEGLKRLNSVKGHLFIGFNKILEDITSLSNLDHEDLSEITIRSNSTLDACSVSSICEFLSSGKPATIFNNGAGCNSFEEIVDKCSSIAIAKIQVRLDLNENGQIDPGEPFYRDALISVNPGNSLFNPNTQNEGTIVLEVDTNYVFTFEETNNPFWQAIDMSQFITPQNGVIDTLVFIVTAQSSVSEAEVDILSLIHISEPTRPY